jgi:hypothetical protein
VRVGRRDAGGGDACGQPDDDLVKGTCHEARVELVEQRGRQPVRLAPHNLGEPLAGIERVQVPAGPVASHRRGLLPRTRYGAAIERAGFRIQTKRIMFALPLRAVDPAHPRHGHPSTDDPRRVGRGRHDRRDHGRDERSVRFAPSCKSGRRGDRHVVERDGERRAGAGPDRRATERSWSVAALPAAYVIEAGRVRWEPAVDVTGIAVRAMVTALGLAFPLRRLFD